MATISATRRRQLLAADYDQKVDQRVAKHECLRNRNNSTYCRSPGRQNEAERQKTELQKKRHLEFLKRRKIDDTETPLVSEGVKSTEPKVSLRTHLHRPPPLNRRSIVTAQDLGIFWPDVRSVEQTSTWVTPVASQRSEKWTGRQQAPNPAPLSSNPTPLTFPLLLETVDLQKRDRGVQTSSSRHTQDTSAQTQSGLITLKESDLQKLADYLQEALRREECLKQKLALLQHHASSLLQSSDKLWTSRCDEDLMKSRIGVLESQLQICTQKLSRDGVKKLVLQMEEQRRGYEQKALLALQRATEEKNQAEERAESLQVALQEARKESVLWKGLYEELKESCGLLRSNQEQSTDLLQQQQNQLEMAVGQEADLRDQLGALQHDSAELRAHIAFLEQDNQVKLEQLQEMREKLWHFEDPSLTGNFFQNSNRGTLGSVAQLRVSDGRPAAELLHQHGAQLQEALEKLGMKEKECVELRAELEAMEHECHSCQSRLAQCREELRQLNVRRSKRRCSSWLGVALLLLLVVVSVALVCVYHPPLSDSLQDLYQVLQQRLEQYLHQMASPELSGCYRPI
ncbi:TRAF3-interacting JNK-activating modulator isoform X1 [Anguilla anguilla]|uniref:TRAF3-interacting JNK-activating modulator isoform X1 n=1 Tax=Anguilla anguilla TaxID=7936 RepID=UPI0015ABB702|nr:TRAF3-interacting JNK-activating modulator isoform X1 [Anguilla anguilla]XP_035237278.1 TRAF3-interacting JNK-activating modulator isoform X1 [Anguilla anguilla]